MMNWSKYNTLFQSDRFGQFLYNSLSNSLLKIDPPHYEILTELRDNRTLPKHRRDHEFFKLLEDNKIIIDRREELGILAEMQNQRNSACLNNTRAEIHICPTLGCNFRCPYCFEHSQDDVAKMTERTLSQVIKFIKHHVKAEHLSLVWYGGEPLIAFDVIRKITAQLKKLDIIFDSASMVTNGYHLNKKIIGQLDGLNIKEIQITLDGLEQMHNSRRMLAGGQPTYQRILSNIVTLMNSDFQGTCAIRVNVDRQNSSQYAALHSYLTDKFAGKKFYVYPGRVNTAQDHSYDQNRIFSPAQWSDFIIGLAHSDGIFPRKGWFPEGNPCFTCVAKKSKGFVIGPSGELYKCGEDVGRQEMEIGNIWNDEPISNPALKAQYSMKTDPFLDAECLECEVLPICGGGCPNRRLRAKQFNEKGLEFCSVYKSNLIRCLEEYYDEILTSKICNDLLNPAPQKSNDLGYQMLQPEVRQ